MKQSRKRDYHAEYLRRLGPDGKRSDLGLQKDVDDIVLETDWGRTTVKEAMRMNEEDRKQDRGGSNGSL